LTNGLNKDDLEFIYGYKTNFKPVTGKALQFIKNRGKESAIFIITQYLTHLLAN